MTIGENIRKYRTEKKISLSKLAAKAGMHPGSLTNIEKGYRNPSVDALSKIADALEVPLAALMLKSSIPYPTRLSAILYKSAIF